MKITINGNDYDVRENCILSEILNDNNFDPAKIVVERNLEILKREEFNKIILKEGDKLEILRFVGGG